MNARPTYTPHDLAPKPMSRAAVSDHGPYSRFGADPVPHIFRIEQYISAPAVEAIRRAFLLSKTSHNGWATQKRAGRFDARQAARATRLEQDVFKRRAGKSITKVRLTVLLDASGSMGTMDARFPNPLAPGKMLRGQRRLAAAIFGATIAKALGTVPTIDLDVFQHAASHQLILKWRWAKGTPVTVFNSATTSIGAGGNADGHALFALTQRALKNLKRDERAVIMVVSDGLPTDYSPDGKGDARSALHDAIDYARKHGVEVIAVAIDGSDQSAYYGKEHMIQHDGSWTHLGAALAKVVGSILATPAR